MNKFKAYILILFSCFTLLKAQEIDSAWVYNNYNKQEIMIPMRDGIKLFTSIYSPKSSKEKSPILMMRTPYSCSPYGEKNYSWRLYKTYWKDYLKEGYIIVIQDVRGKYMSEGEFEDVRPFIEKKNKKAIDESTDSYDAIDWLVKNVKNNNGKVGVFGISYPGFYSTMAAASNHPALKAVSPQAPVTEWFIGDDFHHNGAFAIMDAFSFYSSFGLPRPKPSTDWKKGFQFPNKDNYNFFLSVGPFKNFEKLFSDTVRFWKNLSAHPDYDDFWQKRNARRACYNLKPAMMVVGGLFDAEDCYGAWNLYKAIKEQSPKTENSLVMGPWSHGGWSRGDGSYLGNIRFGSSTSTHYQKHIEEPFFNYYLKEIGDKESLNRCHVFFTGENKWYSFETWPPKYNSVAYFLKEDETISTTAPNNFETKTTYISDSRKPVPYTEDIHLRRTREYMTDDQRFAYRRPDVVSFQTEILESDVTFAGPVMANLFVSLTTTDADFIVKLIDVFPDDFVYDSSYCCMGVKNEAEMSGYQMLVRGEIFRGKYRKSFEKPVAFEINKIDTVKFTLPDIAHTFKKGHRIMVQIQSSWFPLFDRNPQQFVNIYTCEEKDYKKSEITIYHNKQYPSSIILPLKN
ncbi:MAG: CocE/NonD family hydrolase [Bacteroidia bacterium]